MLLTINLLPSELNHPDVDPDAAALQPSDATELNESFADLLELRLDAAPGAQLHGGQSLPEGGELLPRNPLFETDQPVVALSDEVADAVVDDSTVDPAVLAIAPLPVQPQAALPAVQVGASADDLLTTATGNTRSAELKSAATLPGESARQVARQSARQLATQSASQSPVAELPGTKPAFATLQPDKIATGSESPPVRLLDAGEIPLKTRSLIDAGSAIQPDKMVTDKIVAQPESVPDRLTEPARLPLNTPSSITLPMTPQTETLVQGISDVPVQEALPLIAKTSGQLPLQPPSSATTATGTLIAIDTPVQDAKWSERVGERVLFLAGNKLQNAEIRLTPAELGPLRVSIAVQDGATNVTFHAQHAITREAIEQALPRLREMLTENGLTLGQASVGEQGVPQGHRDSGWNADRGTAAPPDGGVVDAEEDIADEPARLQQHVTRSDSLVDTFV